MAAIAPSEPIRLLKIEEELAGPDAAAAMKRHDDVLLALDGRIREALDAGLPPDEFDRVEALRGANVIARKLLRLTLRNNQT